MIDQKVFVDELQKIESSIRKHSNSMADRVKEYIEAINSSTNFVELINNDLINILIQQLKLNNKRSELGIKYIFELLVMKKIKNEQLSSLLEIYGNLKNYNEKVQLKMLQSIFYIIENDNITNGTFYKLFSIVLVLTNDKKTSSKYKAVVRQLVVMLFEKIEKLEVNNNLKDFKECKEENSTIDLVTDSNTTTETMGDIKTDSKNKINDSLILLYGQEGTKIIELIVSSLIKNKLEKPFGLELLNIILNFNIVFNDMIILEYISKQLSKELNANERSKLFEVLKTFLHRDIELKIASQPFFNQILSNMNTNDIDVLKFILSLEEYIFKKEEIFENLISMIKNLEYKENEPNSLKVKIIEYMLSYLTINDEEEKYYIFLTALHKYLSDYKYSAYDAAIINMLNKIITHLSTKITNNDEKKDLLPIENYYDLFLELYSTKFKNELVENILNIKSTLKNSYKIIINSFSTENWERIIEFTKEFSNEELEDIIKAIVENIKKDSNDEDTSEMYTEIIEGIFNNNITRICTENSLLSLILLKENKLNYNIIIEIINNIVLDKEKELLINNYIEHSNKNEEILKILKIMIKRHKNKITEHRLIFNIIEETLNINNKIEYFKFEIAEETKEEKEEKNVEEREKIILIYEIIELMVEIDIHKNLDSYFITKLYIFLYSIISYSISLSLCLNSISLFNEIRKTVEENDKKELKYIEVNGSSEYLRPISNKILSALLNHKHIEVIENVVSIILHNENIEEPILESVYILLYKLKNNKYNYVEETDDEANDNLITRERQERSFIFITNLINKYLTENSINYENFISKYFSLLEEIILEERNSAYKNTIIKSTSDLFKRFCSNRELLLSSYSKILKNIKFIEEIEHKIEEGESEEEINNQSKIKNNNISNIVEILNIFYDLKVNEEEIRKYFIDNDFYYLDKYLLIDNERITNIIYEIVEYIFSAGIKIEIINFYIFMIENYSYNKILYKFNTMVLDDSIKNKILEDISRLIINNKINIIEGLEVITAIDIKENNYKIYLKIFNEIMNMKTKEYDINFYSNYLSKNVSLNAIEDMNYKSNESLTNLTVINKIDKVTKIKIKFLLETKRIVETMRNNKKTEIEGNGKIRKNINNGEIENLMIEFYNTLIKLTYSSTKLCFYAYNLLFHFNSKTISNRNKIVKDLMVKRIKEVLTSYSKEIIIYKELYNRKKKEEVYLILKSIKEDVEIVKELKYDILKCIRSKDRRVIECIEEIMELLFRSYE